ncbi:MAG TPA: HNH endonuclease signature motif containing protein [Chthonomonadaceae bacterium]|nr:HNH endonuclease signature motif containing protein [Chthonomonadaceae bacterium]
MFQRVRTRARHACEYCGVTETDSQGLLTIDHYRPLAHGGGDDIGNLVYSCFRCNLYKSSYWPKEDGEAPIWNPREEPASAHLFELSDGRVLALATIGRETIVRLRLNRAPLVSARSQKRLTVEWTALYTRLAEITAALSRAQADLRTALTAQNSLLEEQQRILQALWTLGP